MMHTQEGPLESRSTRGRSIVRTDGASVILIEQDVEKFLSSLYERLPNLHQCKRVRIFLWRKPYVHRTHGEITHWHLCDEKEI